MDLRQLHTTTPTDRGDEETMLTSTSTSASIRDGYQSHRYDGESTDDGGSYSAYSSSASSYSAYSAYQSSNSNSIHDEGKVATCSTPPSSSVHPHSHSHLPQARGDIPLSVFDWCVRILFPLVERQLRESNQQICGSSNKVEPKGIQRHTTTTGASNTLPSTSTLATSNSSSIRWRSLRWAYLSSYPSIDWNGLYQKLFESAAISEFDRREKSRQQEELLEQFVDFSRNTVELIMEEVHLPSKHDVVGSEIDPFTVKLLSPVPVGGLAGGIKFIFNGILFKFARDFSGLFGATVGGDQQAAIADRTADEFVQKSAFNEIRHMNALIQHDGPILLQAPLFLTMSCCFRIRGSVVMCTALAPIQGGDSLVYGSADGGRTIQFHPDTPAINELASRWNLAQHPVASSSGIIHQLPLATDIEVHASRTDGRLYMLDLARFLPPTPPTPRSMEHLYAMFRPEFMRHHVLGLKSSNDRSSPTASDLPLSLSADAFARFGSIDSARFNSAVQANFRHLKYSIIPQAAKRLDGTYHGIISNHPSITQLACGISNQLSSSLHQSGVNIRYLALVRLLLPTTSPSGFPSLSILLLCDMVCRTVKQLYFSWIRALMEKVGHFGESNEFVKMGWTEVELNQFIRRYNHQLESDEDDEDSSIVSTSHHESSLLFAVLLSLLFTPTSLSSPSALNSIPNTSASRSDSFWRDILWKSVEKKFVKTRLTLDELSLYEADLATRGLEPIHAELKRQISDINSVLTRDDMESFQFECRQYFASSHSHSDTSFVPVLIEMLFSSVGLDFHLARQSIARWGAQFHTPVQLTQHIINTVDTFDSSQPLTPIAIVSTYMLPFTPLVRRVQPIPFISLQESEAAFQTILSARRQRMGMNHPSLLGAMWALVGLYQTQKDESNHHMKDTNQEQHLSNSFSKGVELLQQIEVIYSRLLSTSSPDVIASHVSYAKFGWFYLKFGRLLEAKKYFEQEHQFRVDQLNLIESNHSTPHSRTHPLSDDHPMRSALLALAVSLESLGIIQRELGNPTDAIKQFQACLRTYQRVYGTYGIGLQEQLIDGTTSPENAHVDSNPASSETFRSSLTLATLYTNLANCYGACTNIDMKRQYLEAARNIVRQHGTDDKPHPNMITIQVNLSSCFTQPNSTPVQIDQAKSMLEQCIKWTNLLYPPKCRSSSDGSSIDDLVGDHHSLSSIYSSLASVVGKLGHHSRKITLLERALELAQRQYGPIHPEVAVIQTNLGLSYGSCGDLNQGLAILQQSLTAKTKIFGSPMHQEVAITLTNMSQLFGQAGDWKQEFRSLQQALQIFLTCAKPQSQSTVANPHAHSLGTPQPSSGASALMSNPHFLFAQQRFFRAKQSMASREKHALEIGCCSFIATGTNRTNQVWYKCLTCSPNPKSTLGVCGVCVKRCHSGHEISPQEASMFYCDCGEGVFHQPCKAIVEEEKKKPIDDQTQPIVDEGSISSNDNDVGASSLSSSSPSPSQSQSSSAFSPSPFDDQSAIQLWLSIHSTIQTFMRKYKLSHYVRDFSKDVLLLLHGFRSSFIVDVFASIQVWSSLIDELNQTISIRKLSISPLFRLIDLCDEGVIVIRSDTFCAKLSRDIEAMTQSNLTLQFVNVTTHIREPTLIEGQLRQTFMNYTLAIIKEIYQQMIDGPNHRILALSPLSSDSSLTSAINSLSLTALCGYLLDYPVLYCFHTVGESIAHSSGNNLGMKPLTRYVQSIRIRSSVINTITFLNNSSNSSPTPNSVVSSHANATDDILIYSFTVPSHLVHHSDVATAIEEWKSAHSKRGHLLSTQSCWDRDQHKYRQESVVLPVVAL